MKEKRESNGEMEDIRDGERGDEPGGCVGEAEPGRDTEMNGDAEEREKFEGQTEC